MSKEIKIRVRYATFKKGHGGEGKAYYDDAYFLSVEYRRFFYFDKYGHANENTFSSLFPVEITKEIYENKDIEAAKQMFLKRLEQLGWELIQPEKFEIKEDK